MSPRYLALACAPLVWAIPGWVQAQELVPQVEISFDTSIANPVPPEGGNGYYAPMNIGAVWVETATGEFVKTVYKANSDRSHHLVEHAARAPAGDLDGISGATHLNHDYPTIVKWDLSDSAGDPVANGTYRLVLELADSNTSQGVGDNNLGEFAFVVDRLEATQTPPGASGFDNIAITYQLVEAPIDPPEDEDDETTEDDDGRWTIPGIDGEEDEDGTDSPGDETGTVGAGCSVQAGGAGAWTALVAVLLALVGRRRRRR